MALRLVTTGAVPTVKEAARIAGIQQSYISALRHNNPVAMQYIRKLEADIDAGTVNMSAVLQQLGRKAVARIADIMESEAVKDELRLKAAQDLADRSPETSKTNKISLEADLTLRQGDAKQLMQALVEASQAAEQFRKEVSEGDYVKVDDQLPEAKLPPLLADGG